ncbi:hypothetical protein [Schinkia azotoformans]|uniref:hypothetical protein n=1 Tax=Schinkia azotoformans TaxID=1454 RepID=UPI000587E702|nr:hypothetical protein [Schinkia azotoformans]MED4415623.1 hypothetical protein [Schinkia azotoformans]
MKESLIKIAVKNRPKKRSSLIGFLGSHNKGISKKDIDSIVEHLLKKKIISEENGVIKYSF